MLKKVGGGYLLSGEATFSSGCDHATWLANNSTLESGGMLHILAPMSESEILDNWHVFALAGSGSKFVRFKDCFIPEHRTFPAEDGLNGTTPGSKLYDDPVFRLPRLSIAPYSLVSVSIGCAAGVVEEFIEEMDRRVNRFGSKVNRFQSLQIRVAESAADVRAVESLMFRNIREMTEILARGETVPDIFRVNCKRDMAYCAVVSGRVVDRLFYAWGGNGMYMSNRIQQALRDVKAAAAHHQINWDIYMTASGRMALGLDASGARY